ncbi:MAG TPA: hypothetical protein VJ251_18555 [Stellaceae bacterium]|nr:hypothetical protein [Stellaceae bacterium]
MLTLERTGTPAGKAKPPAAPDGAVALKYLVSEDDCPYHGFFPAPWPVPPGATARYRWYVASSGAGFTGLTLRLEIEGTAPLRVEGIGLSVYRFYNGQVTSMTPVAERAGPLPAEGVVEIADFTVPTVEPQTRRQFLLQLDVNVRMPEAGEATLIPCWRRWRRRSNRQACRRCGSPPSSRVGSRSSAARKSRMPAGGRRSSDSTRPPFCPRRRSCPMTGIGAGTGRAS